MAFDTTIHLGDLITMVMGGILTAIGWGLRKTYYSIAGFVRRVEGIDQRVEDTAIVVDEHTDALTRSGIVDGAAMPKLSKRRRRDDPAPRFAE